MEQNSRINWVNVFKIGGAFTAFQIGAGFASGQEVMQYFGTYGGMYPVVMPLIALALVAFYCIATFYTGYKKRFDDPNTAYEYYCGSTLGKVINILTNVVIGLTCLAMFAGCGATIHQYLGAPVWAGALGIGVVSVLVVCLGLEKLTDVLGVCGIIIIALMVVVGIYNIATNGSNLMETQKNIGEYVEQGTFLQVTMFGFTNPVLCAIGYVTMGFALVMSYNVGVGPRLNSKKECVAAGIVAAILFVAGVYCCLLTVLLNLDYVAEFGPMIPMLSAIENSMPYLALPYTICVCTGIFTTIVGYLWIMGRRFGGADGSTRQRIVVVAMAVFGIVVGSMIPLNQLVNTIFPICSYVGIILMVMMVIRLVKDKDLK